jgi:hypothetical protein
MFWCLSVRIAAGQLRRRRRGQAALAIVGGTITASINGTPVLPKSGDPAITDSSLPGGGIALIVDNAEAEFDDVSVSVP